MFTVYIYSVHVQCTFTVYIYSTLMQVSSCGVPQGASEEAKGRTGEWGWEPPWGQLQSCSWGSWSRKSEVMSSKYCSFLYCPFLYCPFLYLSSLSLYCPFL